MSETVKRDPYRQCFSKGLKLAKSLKQSAFNSDTAMDVKLHHVLSCKRLGIIEVEKESSVNRLPLHVV